VLHRRPWVASLLSGLTTARTAGGPGMEMTQCRTRLSEEHKCCPECGEMRQRIGCETCAQLEFVPAMLKVIEHVRWKYACRSCQEHVAMPPRPAFLSWNDA
jgi:transposase